MLDDDDPKPDPDDADDYEESDYESSAHFEESSCTCDHADDEHGWMECNVEGCPCEAHWESD